VRLGEQPEARPGRQSLVPHLTSAAIGFVVAIAVVVGTDTDMLVPFSAYSYYWLGWPLMCLAVAGISRIWPHRSWRWAMSMAVGQVLGSIFTGAGSMVPVTMMYAVLLSLPQFAVAAAVSRRVLEAQAATHASDDRSHTYESSADADARLGSDASSLPDANKEKDSSS
jgi:hypothetical protein